MCYFHHSRTLLSRTVARVMLLHSFLSKRKTTPCSLAALVVQHQSLCQGS